MIRRRGLGLEDKIHTIFGQLVQQYKAYKKLNCSIATYMPFGEKRNLATGALLKKKGAIRGVPDWLFIKDNGGNAEMIWLEFKTEKGKQSTEQQEFEFKCKQLKNARYYLARSVEDGLKVLEKEKLIIL
jgi:hypothetical protein